MADRRQAAFTAACIPVVPRPTGTHTPRLGARSGRPYNGASVRWELLAMHVATIKDVCV